MYRSACVMYLLEKVYVPTRQAKRLYLGQFVGGQSGNDLAQGGERVVQTLRTQPFPDVR